MNTGKAKPKKNITEAYSTEFQPGYICGWAWLLELLLSLSV